MASPVLLSQRQQRDGEFSSHSGPLSKRWVFLTTLSIVVFIGTSPCLAKCPNECECKWKSGKESVSCENLTSIPLVLDAGTQVLNLTGNNIRKVGKEAFHKAGLLNLQKVFLARCRLSQIDSDAFRMIINLVDLDLSYNYLNYIPSHIFKEVPRLEQLKLSGNPIQRVVNNAFMLVPNLERLELSDCQVGTIEPRAFAGLVKLQWLKLDGNKLVNMYPSAITIMEKPNELTLYNNPWNCSCGLSSLREWMLRENVPVGIPPVCRYPFRLEGKSWDNLDLDEFACVPDIISKRSQAHGVEGNNVTLSCFVEGVPEPRIKWLWKNRVIANLTGISYGKQVYIVHESGRHRKMSNLTITTVDLLDAGEYICSAENKAGKVETNVTLTISKRLVEGGLTGRILVAGIIVAALFVLTVCLVFMCVCSVKRRQERGRRREDSYEKIEMNHKGPPANHTGAARGGCRGNAAASSSNLRTEVAVVSGQTPLKHPKHSEYRGLPCVDMDQVETPMTSRGSAESKLWTVHSEVKDQDLVGSDTCLTVESESIRNASESECSDMRNSVLSDLDSHRPIGYLDSNYKDDMMTTGVLSGGIRKGNFDTHNPQNYSTSSSTSKKLEPAIELKDLKVYSQRCEPSSKGMYISESIVPKTEKNYPDLLEISPYNLGTSASPYLTDSFCTLPRKKYDRGRGSARYRSGSDSQSPLLPESRYSSEGSNSSIRRSSGETYPLGLGNPSSQRSTSSLNLPSEHYMDAPFSGSISGAVGGGGRYRNPSLPASPVLDPMGGDASTPLSGRTSDFRDSYGKSSIPNPSSVAKAAATTYDYHAAQLERFLEEYRNLQEQLCKMKETCESFRHEPTTRSIGNPRFGDPLMGSGGAMYSGALSSTSTLSSEDNPKSILKNKPAAVPTVSASTSSTSPVTSSIPSSSPVPPAPAPEYGIDPYGTVSPMSSYWLSRNSLRRYSGSDFYQS